MTSMIDEPVPAYLVPQPDRFSTFVVRLAERVPRWLGPASVATCMGGAVAYTLLADPTATSADKVQTCLVKLTTGFDCPGCGGTRAFWYLLHGNIPAAARHHAVFVFAVPFLLYLFVAWTADMVFRRKLPPLRITPKTISVFLAAWFVFAVARNLPWEPFTWFFV
jgi:hypothetical protein